MKMRLLAIAVVLLACTATLKAQDKPQEPPTGKFVLMAGTFTTSTGEDQRVILKMDTTTGETWIYESLSWEIKPQVNALVEGWKPVDPDADTKWMALLKKFPNGKMTGPSKP